MDISQKVLAAFSEEHKEFLEGIRSALTALQADAAGADDPRFDEAYRMAHSLKGGARVCELHPIETLGHRLETLFDRVRNSDLTLTPEVTSKVNVVLDAIEDWMVALSEGQELTEPADALSLIDHLLDLAGQEEAPPDRRQSNRQQKLLDAFQREYVGCVQQLRTQLLEIDRSDTRQGMAPFSEMFRVVHSLHRAASVAGVTSVADLGSRLEHLVSQLRIGEIEWHPEVSRCLAAAMDAVEAEMTTSPELRPTECLQEAVQSVQELIEGCCDVPPINRVPRRQPAPSPTVSTSQATASIPAIPPVREVVRISTESLDGLLRSSGQLTTGVLSQTRMTSRLLEMASLVNDLDQARQAARRSLSADKAGHDPTHQLSRLTRFLETADHRIRDLARATRQLQVLQKQSTWLLMRLAQDVQKDVRNARMVPVESLFQGFRKMVRDLARDEQKDVQFLTSGFDVHADRMVLQALKDPVMHLLRNAISHGAEPPDERQKHGKPATATLQLRIEAVGNRLTLTIADDGRGIALARVKDTALKRRLVSEADLAEKSDEELTKLTF